MLAAEDLGRAAVRLAVLRREFTAARDDYSQAVTHGIEARQQLARTRAELIARALALTVASMPQVRTCASVDLQGNRTGGMKTIPMADETREAIERAAPEALCAAGVPVHEVAQLAELAAHVTAQAKQAGALAERVKSLAQYVKSAEAMARSKGIR